MPLNYAEIKDIEIFSTGEWNETKVDQSMLDKLVESYQSIGQKIKPFLKLGHDDEQTILTNSGIPSAGWLTDLRRNGDKLIGSFKDVPRVLADLINNGAYKRVSVELYKDYQAKIEEGAEKVHDWVLKAVALLGAETPAVKNLADVAALYNEKENVYRFVTEIKEVEMNDNIVKFEEEKAKLVLEFKETIKQMENKHVSDIEKIEKDHSQVILVMSEQLEVFKEKEKKAEQDQKIGMIDAGIQSNKIMPNQRDIIVSTFSQLPTDTLKTYLETLPDLGITKQYASTKKSDRSDKDEADFLVKKYMEDNKLIMNSKNFGNAQAVVAKSNPELFGLGKE